MVGGLAIFLAAGFVIVEVMHWRNASRLSDEAKQALTAAVPVEVVIAKGTPQGAPLTLPGETAAWFESVIYARVNGYVANFTSDIGDHVKKGQVLALIDTPELDAALAGAKARLEAGEAAVKLREAEANFAETTYARWRDSPKGVVSEQEREDKKAQNASAQANLAAARANANVYKTEVEGLTSTVQFKQVTAPYDGTITERRIDIGNLVSAGSSSSTTPLFRMSKADPIRIFVEVPQSAAGDLMKPGVAVDITSNDLAGRHFKGTISRTAEAMDPKSRTFRVEIDLANPDLALLPGMYVQVAFAMANHGTVQVPAAAMLFRSDGPQVALVDAEQKVHFSKVSIARDDGGQLELQSGVKPDDKVVLNISSQVREGDQVKIAAVDGKPVQ
jgi:RND family efflux transporter MFP subunit